MGNVSTDLRHGVNSGKGVKVPCIVASTADLTLEAEQTIDGVAVVTGDRVLAKDQSTTTENGIWVVDTGAWTRALDFDGTLDVTQGSLVMVVQGSTNVGLWYMSTAGSPAPGTDAMAFTQLV